MPEAKTNNVTTYYEIHGEGKPLVLIHGASATHDMWQPQISYFSRNYKVLVYDVRGHGQSEGSDTRYSCELFADDLKALLDNLNIQQPYICGLSLGGMIAQAYAVKYNELTALILADTAASSALTVVDKLQKALFPKFAVKLFIRCLSRERYADFSFWFFRKMKPEVKDYLKEQERKFKREELLKVTDAIYGFELLNLSKITVPALIVLGELERKAVFQRAEKMKELIRGSSVVKIPDAMHASNLENPEQFNKVLEEFLHRVETNPIRN